MGRPLKNLLMLFFLIITITCGCDSSVPKTEVQLMKCVHRHIVLKDFVWPDGTINDFSLSMETPDRPEYIEDFAAEGGYRFCDDNHDYTCVIDFVGFLKASAYSPDKTEYRLGDFVDFKITTQGGSFDR